jgi:hypothetical protein
VDEVIGGLDALAGAGQAGLVGDVADPQLAAGALEPARPLRIADQARRPPTKPVAPAMRTRGQIKTP